MEDNCKQELLKLLVDERQIYLPFGREGKGRHFAIYSEDGTMYCPFCMSQLQFNNAGLPQCCEEYNYAQYEVDHFLELQKKLNESEQSINTKILDAAKLALAKHNLERAYKMKDTLINIIDEMEKK